jgi:hypothetical protein
MSYTSMVAVPPCAECGAAASRVELIAPGDVPARWDEWPAWQRDSFERNRDPDAWHLLFDGPAAGSGLGQAVSADRAETIARAFMPPLASGKVRAAGFYDSAGFCGQCGVAYCARHWHVSESGYGTCPRGHGQSLDPHWSPYE